MRTSLFALLSVVVATAAFGSAFMIQPPAPDTHSFVTVTLGGAWPDSCVPSAVQTTVNGGAITLLVRQSPTIADQCAPITTPWRLIANLGLLPAGTYSVHALLQGALSRVDFGTQQFTVRAAEPFRVVPPGAPVSGGARVRLVSPNTWPTTQVIFGDGPPVAATQTSANVLTVVVPPHAAGNVDVKVGLQTAAAGFTYFDPAAPPDLSVFEPVLFPIAFSGDGAFGSSWVTDNDISAPQSDSAIFFELSPVSALVRVDDESPAGVVLHAGRGTLTSTAMSSRIRDLSRATQTAGTEMPIVRENDWRIGIVRLTNIPNDPNARTTLRIWGDHDTPVSVSIEASVKGRTLVASIETRLTQQPNGLLYSQVDLGELVSRIPSDDPRDVTIKYLAYDPDVRLWALATVTNNETQHVTAIWPQ